jgi:PHD/YefM family antitoxin component YafN of YafNO toxin-antitoxin module
MSPLREKAHEIIDTISERKVAEIIDFLEFLKIKEELEATNEILNDENIMESIRKGLKEAVDGDVVNLDDVIENV